VKESLQAAQRTAEQQNNRHAFRNARQIALNCQEHQNSTTSPLPAQVVSDEAYFLVRPLGACYPAPKFEAEVPVASEVNGSGGPRGPNRVGKASE
jgi:hypothetical protein